MTRYPRHFHSLRQTLARFEAVWEKASLLSIYSHEGDLRYRSDICRAAALYAHGGFYFDNDMPSTSTPISEILQNATQIILPIGEEDFSSGDALDRRQVSNSFTGATPRHDVLRKQLLLIVQRRLDSDGFSPWSMPVDCFLLGPCTLRWALDFYVATVSGISIHLPERNTHSTNPTSEGGPWSFVSPARLFMQYTWPERRAQSSGTSLTSNFIDVRWTVYDLATSVPFSKNSSWNDAESCSYLEEQTKRSKAGRLMLWRSSNEPMLAQFKFSEQSPIEINCKLTGTAEALRRAGIQVLIEKHVHTKIPAHLMHPQSIPIKKGYYCNFLMFDPPTGKVIFYSRMEGDHAC